MTRPGPLRTALVWLHRWVGLTLGVLFTLTCVSGTALYFQPQFWEWAHGALTPPNLAQAPASLDRWITNGQAAVPELGRPIALWPPYTEHNLSDAGMLIFQGREPGGFGNTGFVAVLVAPATGDVLGVVDVDRSPAYAPLFFHRDFWSGRIGSFVVGVMALGSMFLLVVGVYLWWPAANRIGRKLAGRPWRLSFTRARPMHDWVGVWTLPILILLSFTGLYIAQPSWVEPALAVMTEAETPSASAAAAAECRAPMSLDEAATRAAALANAAAFRSIYAGDRDTVWEITFAADGSDALHRETHVLADLACGTLVVEATPETRPSPEAAALWLFGLHDGTAFGDAGPVLVSLAGIAPLILMISGFRLWLRTRRVTARSTVRQDGAGRVAPPVPAPQ
jgi:uncharacterized iron-regulated membrane protein